MESCRTDSSCSWIVRRQVCAVFLWNSWLQSGLLDMRMISARDLIVACIFGEKVKSTLRRLLPYPPPKAVCVWMGGGGSAYLICDASVPKQAEVPFLKIMVGELLGLDLIQWVCPSLPQIWTVYQDHGNSRYSASPVWPALKIVGCTCMHPPPQKSNQSLPSCPNLPLTLLVD